uniref:Odorant receptor n=1 Tax=Diabrotica virgifera virgifera TaxID=50390 RepID=A0A6P7FRV9_DIAVI
MLLDTFAYRTLKTYDYCKLLLWIPKVLLETIFLWPTTKNHELKSTFACIVNVLIMTFIEIGLFLNLSSVDSIPRLVFIMSLVLGAFQSIYKILIIWYKAKYVKDLIDDVMTKFWPYDLIEGKVKEDIRRFYVIFTCIMTPLVGVGLCWGIGFLIPPYFFRKLPFPIEYGFEWSTTPTYEILYIIQSFGYQVVMLCGVCGTDTLFISIGASAVTQYRILHQCLASLNKEDMVNINNKLDKFVDRDLTKSHDRVKEFFVRCLKHHQLLLEFTGKINNAFGLVVLIQLSCSVAGICVAALLVSRASLLPESIYASNWIELKDKTMKKDVMFLIHHSQQIPKLSAYSLYNVDMNSYLKVVKLAFSVYTLLLKLQDKQANKIE